MAIEPGVRIDDLRVVPIGKIASVAQAAGVPLEPGVTPIPEDALRRHDRITVLGHIHYEQYMEQPFTFPFRTTMMVDSQLEPVRKRMIIEHKPTALYLGDLEPERVCILAIENRSGRHITHAPTKEEASILANQIVRVRLNGSTKGFLVRPKGMPFLAEVESSDDVILEAVNEEPVHINLCIFPK